MCKYIRNDVNYHWPFVKLFKSIWCKIMFQLLVYTLENGSWALCIRNISIPPKHLHIKHEFFPLMNLYLLLIFALRTLYDLEFFRIKNPSIWVSSFFQNCSVVLLASSIETSSLSLIPSTFPFDVFSIIIKSPFTWKFHSSLECQIYALLIKVDLSSFHNWPRNKIVLITESVHFLLFSSAHHHNWFDLQSSIHFVSLSIEDSQSNRFHEDGMRWEIPNIG